MNDYLKNMKNGQTDKGRTPKTRKNFNNTYPYSAGSRFNTYGSNYPNTRGANVKRSSGGGIQGGNRLNMDDATVLSMLVEALGTLNNLVDNLLKAQDDMITVQERNSDMMERQAIAMEKIVNQLHHAPIPGIEGSLGINETKNFKTDDISKQQEQTVPETLKQKATSVKPKQKPKRKPQKFPKNPKVSKAKSAKPKKDIVSTDAQNKDLPREAILKIIKDLRTKGATFDQIAQHLVDIKQPTFSGRGVWHAQTIHRLCKKK